MNGIGGKVLAAALSLIGGLCLLALGGAFSVHGQQSAIKTDVKNNKETAQKCCEVAHETEVVVGAIQEWIRVDRDRSEREHTENIEAHREINRKLDKIIRNGSD